MRIESLFPEPSQRPEPSRARRADAPAFDVPEPRREDARPTREPRERGRSDDVRETRGGERQEAVREAREERRAEARRPEDAVEPPRDESRAVEDTAQAVDDAPSTDRPTAEAAPDVEKVVAEDETEPTEPENVGAPLVVPGKGDEMRADAAKAALAAAGDGEAKSAAKTPTEAQTPVTAAIVPTEAGTARPAAATGTAPATGEAAAVGAGAGGGAASGSTGGEAGSGEGGTQGRQAPTAQVSQTAAAATPADVAVTAEALTGGAGTAPTNAAASEAAAHPGAGSEEPSGDAKSIADVNPADTKSGDAKPASPPVQAPQPVAQAAQPMPTAQPVLDPGLAQAATPPPGATSPSAGAPPGATPSLPQPPVVANVPLGAVPFEIGLKSLGGVDTFTIRLDPDELGRVDVTLEISDGEVSAKLLVERPETLALLQRDARALERAFEQAGLRTTDQSVQMSLRDDGRGGDGRGEPGGFGREGDGRGGQGRENNDGRGDGVARRPEIEALVASRMRPGVLGGVDVRI